jgi:RimJ/RimL family protein N-acetyltransferase
VAQLILEGQRVRLRPATSDDLAAYTRWFTDAEFRRYMGTGVDVLRSLVSPPADQANFSVETADGRLIGLVMITNVRTVNRSCALGYVGLGEKDCWDQGLGTEIVKLALRYCFRELNMHQVFIHTAEFNERARRCYGKIFPHAARHRECEWQPADERFYDQIFFDILEDEFGAMDSSQLQKMT